LFGHIEVFCLFKLQHMNKLLSTITVLFVFANFVAAQETVDMAIMQKIKDEEKTNSQITTIAHNLTDVCGPRLTNSPRL